MKIGRKIKGTPSGASLTLNIQYNVADIKAALIHVNRNRQGGSIGITIDELVGMLYDIATDHHMPDNARQYIEDWMARRAIKEGFVFKANDYLGETASEKDIFLIDAETVRKQQRGVSKRKSK